MENVKGNYSNGVRYAIKEVYANVHNIKDKVEEIKKKYGEEAGKEFLNGYYNGLTFFTHAINYVKSGKLADERANIIESEYNKDLKEAFLMGLNFYNEEINEEKSNKTK